MNPSRTRPWSLLFFFLFNYFFKEQSLGFPRKNLGSFLFCQEKTTLKGNLMHLHQVPITGYYKTTCECLFNNSPPLYKIHTQLNQFSYPFFFSLILEEDQVPQDICSLFVFFKLQKRIKGKVKMTTLFSSVLQNRAPKVSVFIFFLISLHCLSLISVRVLAQTSPVFACDATKDPQVASYGFCDTKLGPDARVADLVHRLTLQEKILFIVNSAGSVSRLGIPKYEWWSEALHGVSNVGPGTKFTSLVPGATSFPQVILTAASFNTSLYEAIGKVKLVPCSFIFYPLFWLVLHQVHVVLPFVLTFFFSGFPFSFVYTFQNMMLTCWGLGIFIVLQILVFLYFS